MSRMFLRALCAQVVVGSILVCAAASPLFAQGADPFGNGADPFGGGGAADPFGGGDDPFGGGGADPFGGGGADPFGGNAAPAVDPFGGAPVPVADPFAAPARPAKEAEKPAPAKVTKVDKPKRPRRYPTTNRQIEAALGDPVKLEFVETPLRDVAAHLRDMLRINVELDIRALDDVGLGDDTPVTLSVKNVSLRSGLRLMLRELDLTYTIEDGNLLITTPEEAESRLITRLYRIDKLLPKDDFLLGRPQPSADDLIDVLTSAVRPTTWDEVGGMGSAAMLRKMLVVSQTPDVHDEIAQTLTALEDASKAAAAAGNRPPKILYFPQLPKEVKDSRVAAIMAALDKPAEFKFIETPLQDVAEFVRDKYDINVQIDHRALEDVGIGSDTPVTINVKNVSLRAALRLFLREMDLVYIVRDEVLLITTPEESESELLTRIYPVVDLIGIWDQGGFLDGEQYADYDSLIDLITATVRPTMWDEVGGVGSIDVYNGCLVVSQTSEVLERLGDLLAGLRRVNALHRAHPKKVLTESIRVDEQANPRVAGLRAALSREVGMLGFSDASLEDVAKMLAEHHGVPIQIDRRALEDIGIDAGNVKLSASLGGETLGQALRRILRGLELTWAMRDEVILITTPEEAESELITRIYPVRDLVLPAGDSFQDETAADYDSLIDLITSTIDADMWECVGGPGAIEPYPANFTLVISQVEQTHEKIAKLLAEARRVQAAEEEAATDTKKADDEDKADDNSAPAHKNADANVLRNKQGERVYLKVYRLAVSDHAQADELAEVIHELVEPQTWKTDEAYYLRALAGAIVVRHTAAAHRKIDALLSALDARQWPQFNGNFGGGQGVGSGQSPPQGGFFAVPDHIQGQFGTGSLGPVGHPVCGVGLKPYSPVTTVAALSLPASGDRAAMPLRIYDTALAGGDELAETVAELIEPESWQSEGCYLHATGTKLIVRQRAAAHRKVARLLLAVGAIAPPFNGPMGTPSIPVVGALDAERR